MLGAQCDGSESHSPTKSVVSELNLKHSVTDFVGQSLRSTRCECQSYFVELTCILFL